MAEQPAMSPSDTPVETVLQGLPDAKRDDAAQLIRLMTDVTGEEPRLWAGRIIGFGRYRYRYDSGHEGDAPLAGFATNARQHTIYLVGDFAERYATQVARLGKARTSKACLYVNKLADVDLDVLRTLVDRSARVARGADVGGEA